MNRYSVCKEIKLKADTVNFKDGEIVKARVTLLDSNKQDLGVKNDTATVKKNHVEYPFKVKDLAKELNVSKDKIKYIKGWIDADGDGEVEYEEEVEAQIVFITKEMLSAMGFNLPRNIDEIIDALNKYMPQYEINTCLRVAHFLAQAAHESGGFQEFEEGKKYRKAAARDQSEYRTYEKELKKKYLKEEDRNTNNIYFPNNQKFAEQPELFNLVYGDENGNTKASDGFDFRGRGAIQITGRGNYKSYTLSHNSKNPNDIKDFENNASHREELITNKKYAIESACWYWKYHGIRNHNINLVADRGSTDDVVLTISKEVNGYVQIPNGYDELGKPLSRLPLFHKLKEYMKL